MSYDPLVSVIIPTYNSRAFIGDAVQSALNQTYQRVEIIVVDDGSTDNTAQTLTRYRNRICYIHQPNSGPAAARNTGIRLARGELVAFLDADDLWDPAKLEIQVPYLLANPKVGLVHHDLIYCDENQRHCTDLRRPRAQFSGNCYQKLFFCNHIVPSAVLMWKEIAVNVGLFDAQSDFRGCEDYDLWIRVARKYEIGYLPRHLTIYRRHALNMSRDELRMTKSVLMVLLKILRLDPTLENLVGPTKMRKRLYDLYFQIGYSHWDAGNPVAARPYFREALRLKPFGAYVRGAWGATYLPAAWVRLARKLKQLVGQTRDERLAQNTEQSAGESECRVGSGDLKSRMR